MDSWASRRRGLLLRLGIVAALAVIAIESFLLYQQRAAGREARDQSAQLLGTFLKGDTARDSSRVGVPIRLQNVRFKWSEKVFVDAGNMAVLALPIRGASVDFDDPGSFLLKLQQSTVILPPAVLEGMLNESVFNYPESKLRDLKVALTEVEGGRALLLSGKVNLVFWIPFKMLTRLSVDHGTNTLVMEVDRLKLLGVIPATPFVRWTPFHLDRLITMPPNKSLIIDGNRLMVKPFGLFPPPRITGTIAGVTVDDSGIRLQFSGEPIQAPQSSARNYVYLRGGTSQFGHFSMVDTDVLIVDANEANPFVFSLLHYAEMIPSSVVEVHDTHSARVTMPDYASR